MAKEGKWEDRLAEVRYAAGVHLLSDSVFHKPALMSSDRSDYWVDGSFLFLVYLRPGPHCGWVGQVPNNYRSLLNELMGCFLIAVMLSPFIKVPKVSWSAAFHFIPVLS